MRSTSLHFLALGALLLGGCPTSSSSSSSGSGSGTSASTGDEGDPVDVRDRPDMRRAGLISAGSYLFEIAGASGEIERRAAQLERFDAGDLELLVDGARVRTTREAAWPMLCLTRALSYGDGAMRVQLEAGAPVYVIASTTGEARVGPVPRVPHGRIVDRAVLSLEGCAEDGPGGGTRFVAETAASDTACLFADPDPADESEGLPVASGASLEELDRAGEWARVRVRRPGGTLEGWIDASLVASGGGASSPDWASAALRPQRCAFPGRPPAAGEPQAWVERSADAVHTPSTIPYEAALHDADPRVRGCWNELPEAERPAAGARVDVRLEVDGDGQVERAAVVRNDRAPDALARCIIERASRIRFPAPRTGLVLRRTYAFDPPRVATPARESDDDDL